MFRWTQCLLVLEEEKGDVTEAGGRVSFLKNGQVLVLIKAASVQTAGIFCLTGVRYPVFKQGVLDAAL
jgi:hypothetical protein